jgi:hypothetical protein
LGWHGLTCRAPSLPPIPRCLAGRGIGQFAIGSMDALCQRSLGGTWLGAGSCRVTMPLTPNTVDVNLTGIAQSLLHACETNRA